MVIQKFTLQWLLAPVIILAFFIPSFIFVGALWMLVLPMTMINAVKMFARNTKKNMQREHETDRA
jgi:hypothetical protein